METTEVQSLQRAFRDAMAQVCSPVAVVTTLTSEGLAHGTTVSAFTSLSLEPPMVLISLDRRSTLLTLLGPGQLFGVNVLLGSQIELARQFAAKGGPRRFSDPLWTRSDGVPRLAGSGAFLACRVERLVGGGDHVIVLGAVTAADRTTGPPLTYHDRTFGTHTALGNTSRPAAAPC